MPYIIRKRKGAIFEDGFDGLLDTTEVESAGELNYAITALIRVYLIQNVLSYQTINDVKGALQGALSEFDRRIVAPYEDKKKKANGDVYTKVLKELKKVK